MLFGKRRKPPAAGYDKAGKISVIRSSAAEHLTFGASTGNSADSIEMRYMDENIWLTQKMMAGLYDVRTINYHISKVFERCML